MQSRAFLWPGAQTLYESGPRFLQSSRSLPYTRTIVLAWFFKTSSLGCGRPAIKVPSGPHIAPTVPESWVLAWPAEVNDLLANLQSSIWLRRAQPRNCSEDQFYAVSVDRLTCLRPTKPREAQQVQERRRLELAVPHHHEGREGERVLAMLGQFRASLGWLLGLLRSHQPGRPKNQRLHRECLGLAIWRLRFVGSHKLLLRILTGARFPLH